MLLRVCVHGCVCARVRRFCAYSCRSPNTATSGPSRLQVWSCRYADADLPVWWQQGEEGRVNMTVYYGDGDEKGHLEDGTPYSKYKVCIAPFRLHSMLCLHIALPGLR